MAYDSCSSLGSFSHLITKLYAEKCLGKGTSERITALTHELIDTYKELIKETGWLGDEARTNLLEKLDNMTLNILEPISGYYDYSTLELVPAEEGGTLFGNYLRLKEHIEEQDLKILKSSTPAQLIWYIESPVIQNAFYEPMNNSINIYPGIVTSFMYTDDMKDEILIGRLGSIIAHEISHAFDYIGAQFNGYGEPEPVFADEDLNNYLAICRKLSDYYSTFMLTPDIPVNGDQVMAEATADLSGVQAMLTLAEEKGDIDFDLIAESYTNLFAAVIPDSIFGAFAADGHPLAHYRINVNLQMFDNVYEEFGITEEDGMYLAPEDRINLWGRNAA